MHTYKDLTNDVDAWYFHSTYVWLIVMFLASLIFLLQWKKISSKTPDLKAHFKTLPSE